ncbi:ubiquitin-activating enzyme e1 [Vairimorpha apis BRL 01]|uniref:Ubiquitin-activating enzyme e1 n=1 Tax=Vairimorpha apis BRL 01 TaxID=1037528 RepID=T0KZ65_9MICR|nr:ubiquitin-activating enzyme e1 [Vairimorpha apis BRL 01]
MIDESLYSRQLYVIGKEAMEKMMNSKILIIGLDGLGQEVVKNICLAGVSQVSIYDISPVTLYDLNSGFYFSHSDIGKKRDESLLEKFKNLNNYVNVNILENIEDFKNYNLVISCNKHVHEQMKFNRQARRDNCKFIGCQSRGVFSQIFNDFGTDFICIDTNGENVKMVILIKISNQEAYEGMLFKVKGLCKNSVQLTKIDGASIIQYTELPFTFKEVYGGDYEQIKKPKIFNFKSMEDTIEDPQILSYNFDSDAQNVILHKCFLLLSEYVKEFLELPNDETFVPYFLKKYNNLYNHENFIKSFGRLCNTSFVPLNSVVGGFVAQEAIKAVSYKFSPLLQYMYFDVYELLPEFDFKNEINKSRYNSLELIFGTENVKKLHNLKVFLVGAGAIGCEHLKNLVMCGIGHNGCIHVTDMDSIEQSNLNRQFLFNKYDVGKMKAEVAVKKVLNLNEDFSNDRSISNDFIDIDATKEAQESKKYNVDARLYVDNRCVLNRKSLVDAGTSGTKGNVQVIVPFFSESYGSSRDPPEKSIPLCTIKNFPHAIEHAIEWAMSEFRFRFHDQIIKIKDYLEHPDDYINDESEEKEKIIGLKKETVEDLAKNAPRSIEECIKFSLRIFVRYFHTSIQDLLKTFPPDCLTKEGQPFWMPPKRAPVPINFDLNNDLHLTFVRSMANIYRDVYQIHHKRINNDFVRDYINSEASNYIIKHADKLTVKGIAGRIIPAIATTTSVISGLAIIELIKLALKVKNIKYRNSYLNLALPYFGISDLIEAQKLSYIVDNKKYKYTMWNRVEYKDNILKNILKAVDIQFKIKVSMVTCDNKLLYWDQDPAYDCNLDKMLSDLINKVEGRKYVVIDCITQDEISLPNVVVIV